MKRILILTSLISFIIVQSGFGQISGTAHDFSGDGWNTSGEICIVCHTPHNADVSVSEAPLWNHELAAATGYTPYSGSTLNATVGQPTAESKLCLCCHDGTVGLENFGATTGGTANLITGDALLGKDLSDDHPISFTYNTALSTADGGLFDPATDDSGLGGTIAEDLLFGGIMQCSSCHDVHSNVANFLIMSNAASALCLTCHDK